jgi:hypothetical protein
MPKAFPPRAPIRARRHRTLATGLIRAAAGLASLLAAALVQPGPAAAAEEGYPRAEINDIADTATLISGGITARLRVAQTTAGPTPVLSVEVVGRRVAEVPGIASEFGPPFAAVRVAEMDRSNPYPEVAFTSFSGGAHCCTRLIVITSDAEGRVWRYTTVGDFDDGDDFLRDIDKDGRAEIVAHDDAFLYAFDCYACSVAPLKIYRVEKGAVIEATRDTRYRSAHQAWLAEMEARARPDADGRLSNGYLAGWVATKILLGEGNTAWAEMLARFDRQSTWGLMSCKSGAPIESCPPGSLVARSFPEALASFLAAHGYVD